MVPATQQFSFLTTAYFPLFRTRTKHHNSIEEDINLFSTTGQQVKKTKGVLLIGKLWNPTVTQCLDCHSKYNAT